MSLRILQVIHQFPPYSSQGSEVYCYNLARELARTDDVRVFHVSNTTRRWHRRLMRSTYGGLSIYHCADWGEYSRLADWPNPFLRRTFRSVLDEYRPQIVHFHNYLSLGDDLVSATRETGASVVYTLHDFGLICPNALLLRDDRVLCDKSDPDFFAHCCPFLIRTSGRERDTVPWYGRVPGLARWHLFIEQNPQRAIRALLRNATGVAAQWRGAPNRRHIERKREFFFTHTRRIFRDVDLFLAPSQFLLQRYVSCGVPREKAVHVRYGMRHFARREPTIGHEKVRFGYIGALHPHKGIEVLLEAFRDLGDRATLHVYGSAFDSPISRSYWRRLHDRDAGSVTFHGAYENDAVGAILAGFDVVVVPSLWYENSPLTIQEAFIAGVPVITAGVGGMAELVRDGIDGLHFRLGDADDLRAKLLTVIEHPELCAQLRSGIPSVPSIEEHAADLRARFQQLSHSSAGTTAATTKDRKEVVHEVGQLEAFLAQYLADEGLTFDEWIAQFGEGSYASRNEIILDLLAPVRPRRVLELACAGGYLAKSLLERVDSIETYTCSNFSAPVLRHCEQLLGGDSRCQVKMIDANVVRSDDFIRADPSRYDTILTTSFEHIEFDRELITHLPTGAQFIFCVASFDDPEHFRSFRNEAEIVARYGDILEILDIRSHENGFKFVVSARRGITTRTFTPAPPT